MENENELFEITNKNNILLLTMNAPNNNIMTDEFLHSFEDAIENIVDISKNNDIKALIICSGGRHFSVGADVNSLVSRTSEQCFDIDDASQLPQAHIKQKHAFTLLYDMPIPVISAIKGFCIGSGSEIAVNSHIRICEKSSRIGQPESTFGILPALGGIARTVEICGISTTAEIVFTGHLFTATEAFEYGWADIVCEKNQSLYLAFKLADIIANSEQPYSKDNICQYIELLRQSAITR